MNRIVELIQQDPVRLLALQHVRALNLPQCYIAAGFVRNLVWDYLHNVKPYSALNDVDVVYFDPTESNPDAYLVYEAELKSEMPELNWQVRNQAVMHGRNGDPEYTSSLDAMSYWPEKETAVAIRLRANGEFDCISAFGFESLFGLCVTYNLKRSRELFESRVSSKGWLTKWPKLQINKPKS